jgi:hypothetical protein
MKHLMVLFSILCGMSAQDGYAQKAGDGIFSGVQVHTINLRFPRADYWDSLLFYYNRGDEQCILAHAVIDGAAIDSIGVRFKGNSSFGYPNNKKSFRLSFDEFRNDGRWDGLKGVHLNNMWGDPSFMREKVYLDFCSEAGIAAPRANYARLSINDTLFAFYSLVEHVDKTFLDTRFSNKAGNLFKAVDGIGAGDSLISDFAWLGADTARYLPRYELKTDGSLTAWPQLIGFIDTLAHSSDQAATLQRDVDLPALNKAIAADILFSNLDSYLNSGRNFYAYFHSKTGMLSWIIWDAGLSFGAYGGGVSTPENLPVTYLINPASRPLMATVFREPALVNDYLQTLCALHSSSFTTGRMFPHIDSIAALIRPHIAADQRKMYTSQQFETNISNDVTIGGSRKPGLKSFLTARSASVQAQLAALGITCVTGTETADAPLPARLVLAQNYPNPSTRRTTISYTLPASGHTTLTVYDALGRAVATLVDRAEDAGVHSFEFDSGALPGGFYRYELAQGRLRVARTLLVQR